MIQYTNWSNMSHAGNALQPEFWDKVAKVKQFKDPFYLGKLKEFLSPSSMIIEYGCGYGRLLNVLYDNGYHNVFGFDFSRGMIERGSIDFPHLTMQYVNHANLPLQTNYIDAAILSTVLCCTPDKYLQAEIINEMARVLKPNGILYVSDFLVTKTNEMTEKYQKNLSIYNEWGIYLTSEGALVRHHTQEYIKNLLENFEVLWYIEEDFVTMNNNIARTFHGIYRKIN